MNILKDLKPISMASGRERRMDGRFCRMKWKPKSTTAEALISSRMRLPACASVSSPSRL